MGEKSGKSLVFLLFCCFFSGIYTGSQGLFFTFVVQTVCWIAIMRILVTYAMPVEFTEVKFRGLLENGEEVQVGYLRTGVGKAKSAFYLAEAVRSAQPDLVLNVGTAGTLHHRVGDVFVCTRFIDRDMRQLASSGIEYEIDSAALLEQRGYCRHWPLGGVCNTGDTFLREGTEVEGDVVDMEAYAQALVCRARKIPFVAVKCVTDVVGQNPEGVWDVRAAEARNMLTAFLEQLGGVVA